MATFKRVGVVLKTGLSCDDAIVKAVLGLLAKNGCTIAIDTDAGLPSRRVRCSTLNLAEPDVDVIVILGGDGTVIRTVRALGDLSIPLIGVNRGGIGFLTEIDARELDSIVPLLCGEYVLDERGLLEVTATRKNDVLFSGRALNEAVIAQGAIARILNLQTLVNGELLTTYRADGLILSTPTGSTAYSLSAGGPIVHPRLPALILTPLNPHTFGQKPIVIPGTSPVDVTVQSQTSGFHDVAVSLTIDGQLYVPLARNDVVRVALGAKQARFLRRGHDTFFGALRKKLKWGDRP